MFYLVLRGLDTVEDDMSIPDVRARCRPHVPAAASAARRGGQLVEAVCVHAQHIKLPALLSFHERIYERDFSAARRALLRPCSLPALTRTPNRSAAPRQRATTRS